MKWSIVVDFDGVLHQYVTRWTDAYTISDGPMPGAFAFIRHTIDAGYRLVLYTARLGEDVQDKPRAKAALQSWFLDNGLEARYVEAMVYHENKPAGLLFIDDRAHQFKGEFPSVQGLRAFRPWKLR